jgi:hypothetical protein
LPPVTQEDVFKIVYSGPQQLTNMDSIEIWGRNLNEIETEFCRISLKIDNLEANVHTLSAAAITSANFKPIDYHCDSTFNALRVLSFKLSDFKSSNIQHYVEYYSMLYSKIVAIIYFINNVKYNCFQAQRWVVPNC